jgi:hypothetical protein
MKHHSGAIIGTALRCIYLYLLRLTCSERSFDVRDWVEPTGDSFLTPSYISVQVYLSLQRLLVSLILNYSLWLPK